LPLSPRRPDERLVAAVVASAFSVLELLGAAGAAPSRAGGRSCWLAGIAPACVAEASSARLMILVSLGLFRGGGLDKVMARMGGLPRI